MFEIFEINNVFYVVCKKGILTLKNKVYKLPSNKKYDWCATCLIENNIFVVRSKYGGEDVEGSLFNTTSKQWSDANVKTKRKYFTIVYFLKMVWILGGSERDENGKLRKLDSIITYDPATKTQNLSPIKMMQVTASLFTRISCSCSADGVKIGKS